MMAIGSFVTPGINHPVLHRNDSEGLSPRLLLILKIALTYYLKKLNLIYVQEKTGSVVWSGSMDVDKEEEQAVLIFERKIFRRIHVPKYENGEWKSRTYLQLEEMSKGEIIVKWIKGQRISWLGHLERMEEDRMPKKIFSQEQEGTIRRGRRRKRWKEEAERDLQVLGVRRWRELVADRKK